MPPPPSCCRRRSPQPLGFLRPRARPTAPSPPPPRRWTPSALNLAWLNYTVDPPRPVVEPLLSANCSDASLTPQEQGW